MVLGVDSYVMVLNDSKITLWFVLLLLRGMGNGYDEWSLSFNFTVVVLRVGVLWHNF